MSCWDSTEIEHSTCSIVNPQQGRHISQAPCDYNIKSKLLSNGHTQSSVWLGPLLSTQQCLLPHAPCTLNSSNNECALIHPSSLCSWPSHNPGIPVFCWSAWQTSFLSNLKSYLFWEAFLDSPKLTQRVKSCTEGILFSILTGCTKIKDRDLPRPQQFHSPVLNAVPNSKKTLKRFIEWINSLI